MMIIRSFSVLIVLVVWSWRCEAGDNEGCVRVRRETTPATTDGNEPQWHSLSELQRDMQVAAEQTATTTVPTANTTTSTTTTTTAAPKTTTSTSTTTTTEKVRQQRIDRMRVIVPPPPLPPPSMPPGTPPFYPSPPVGPPPRLGAIPRWNAQMPPPPPWAEPPSAVVAPSAPSSWRARAPPSPPLERYRQKDEDSGDVLDRLLLDEETLKKRPTTSQLKWPLRGDSDRHTWNSREGDDLYWELASSKTINWRPREKDGSLWKAGRVSTQGVAPRRRWDDELERLSSPTAAETDEWHDRDHGGVPKPPIPYLREHRRPV